MGQPSGVSFKIISILMLGEHVEQYFLIKKGAPLLVAQFTKMAYFGIIPIICYFYRCQNNLDSTHVLTASYTQNKDEI